MEYDVKIVGGTLIDGTGAAGVRGDLGITGGRIVALGEAKGSAREVIEADGHVVCPGFVDIHTHYDAQILWDRMTSISPWHGVTTALIGNCGFGVAPTRAEHRRLILKTLEKVEGMDFAALEAGLGADWPFVSFPQYLDTLERRGSAINVAAMVGHTPTRLFVMGEAATERAATEDEVERMRVLVREALAAGAAGFATSKAVTHVGFEGRPVPSRLAEKSEILALADEVGAAGRGIVQATIGPGLFLNEFEEIAARTGRPVTWTALLAGAFGPAEANRKLLQRTARVLETGRRVIPQVSCRPLNFEYDFVEPFLFEQMPLFAELARVDGAGRRARLASGEFRARFRAELPPFLAGWTQRTVFSWSPLDRALEERPLEAVAAERGADPVDLALDLALQNDLRLRLRTAASNYDEAEVGELLADRNTVVALSDAGAHAAQLCDACYSTHLLGHWVRDKGVLPLERAIHMLTGQPAELLGLTSRGRLAPGLAADVVVFDPATVGAGPLRRVNDLPGGAERLVADASGIEAVLVNGTILRRANRDTVDPEGALPGGLLRNLPQ